MKNRLPLEWIASVALLSGLACGDDEGSGGDVASTTTTTVGGTDTNPTGATDPSSTTLTTSATATTNPTSTSTDGTTGTATNPTTTDTTVGTESTGTTDTGDGSADATGDSTGGQGNVEYKAYGTATALDRIWIFKTNHDTGTCTLLVAASPGGGGGYPVIMPDQWGVSDGWISDDIADCSIPWEQQVGEIDWFSNASGSIDWEQANIIPCIIDVDVVMTFPQTYGWVPATDTLKVNNLDVEDCL